MLQNEVQTDESATPMREPSRTSLSMVVAVLALALAILGLDSVLVITHASSRFDRQFELDIHREIPGGLHPFFLLVSTFVGPAGIALLALIGAAYYTMQRVPEGAVLVAGGLAGGSLLDTIGKHLVHRHRPHLWSDAMSVNSYSYPSGHATAAMAFFAALAYVVWRRHGPARGMVVGGGGAAIVFAVGLSRIYLGVHWPTDVLGGYALGIAWVALLVLLLEFGVLRFAVRYSRKSSMP